MNSFETFKKLHQQDKVLLLPNAWDAASARLFEELGATAIATTSAGLAWSQGYADGGKMTAARNARTAADIARVIKVPLTVDFENGYSDDPEVVAENTKLLLDMGVAGINIEDGKDSPDLLSKKIEAIKRTAARHDSDLFINARTDVFLAKLVEPADAVTETIRRANLYASAGCDGLFVPFIVNPGEIASITQSVSLPLNVLSIPGLPGAVELAGLGVKRLSAGSGIATVVWQKAAALAELFLAGAYTEVIKEQAMPGSKLNGLFG